MDLSFETIEALIDLATAKNLSELTVEADDQKVTIKTAAAAVAAPMVATVPAAAAISPTPEKPAEAASPKPEGIASSPSNWYKVTSPMVGTYYKAPSPEAPAFVEVGDTVSVGQTLCIIEAMKLMNELESEVSGVVRKITAQNGSPVEFGQVLMEIEVQSN